MKIETQFVVSIPEIMRACRLSKPAVIAAVKRLRKKGLIATTRRGSSASVYHVLDAEPLR